MYKTTVQLLTPQMGAVSQVVLHLVVVLWEPSQARLILKGRRGNSSCVCGRPENEYCFGYHERTKNCYGGQQQEHIEAGY